MKATSIELEVLPLNQFLIRTKRFFFSYRILSNPFSLIFLFLFLFLFLSTSIEASVGNDSSCMEETETVMGTTGPVSFAWGTYYGQSINNVFNDVKVDADGNIYAFGSTIQQGFDGLLVKFNASGALQWERFLGGSDGDNFNADDNYDYGKLALDDIGNVYVTGITASDDFPTQNPFQANRGGGLDAFVAKYDSDGNILLSSFLGGATDENTGGAGDIVVDASGNIFVTGTTTSDAFFDNNNAYQPNFSGGTASDIFVVKISADFSTVAGTYWGDEKLDVSRGITIDDNGVVWVVGASDESGLTLPGSTSHSIEGLDGIVLGWDNNLNELTNGTFFGGIFDEEITDVDVDPIGNLYLTGGTYSTSDFPIVNAFESNYQGGQMAFATKMSASGTLIWSTFLGGSQNDKGNAITIDNANNVYVTGMTASRDFPDYRSVQATFNDWNCLEDGFVFKFNADGTQDWATYYGGWREEMPTGVAVNSNDQVIIVGKTKSIDLPTSTGAYQEDVNFAGLNAFMATFEIACPSTPIIIHSTEDAVYYDQFWCSNYYISGRPHFRSDSCAMQFIAPPGYTNYQWFRNGSSIGTSDQIIDASNPHSNNSIINYHVELNNGLTCSSTSISNPKKINWVRPMCGFGSSFNEDELPHKSNIVEGYDNEFFCEGDVINFNLSVDGFCESTIQWQKDFEDIPNATDFNFNVSEVGCYRVALTNNFTGCTVYSRSKRFILVDSILVNDYYAYQTDEECLMVDTLNGCTNVFLKARIKTCLDCQNTPSGITYEWHRDGTPISGGNNGSLNTSIEGTYTTKVTLGNCEIFSNPVYVSIQPTEPPIWVLPTSSVCIAQVDSVILAITHPDINDSALVKFDLPYPSLDIVGYDSIGVVHNANSGCVDVDLTRRDGCRSSSVDIEFHDSLTARVEVVGTYCLPARLRMKETYSCEMDSLFWMKGDSIVRLTWYASEYTVQEAGDYYFKVKNACGTFISDTVTIQGNIPTPDISPNVPVCLPANISLNFSNPDSSIVIHWYRNPSPNGCYTHTQYLLPDEHEPTLVAGFPGFYFAVLEDTISGCKSLCSQKVEVQQSAAGASLNPSSNIYFCDGDGTDHVTFTVNQSSSSFDYQWYRNNVPIVGATNQTYTTNEEGVYRVFLENTCDNAFTPSVSIYNIPNPTVEISTPDTIYLCGPDTIPLSTTSDQPIIFQWYLDDVAITDAIDSFFLATTSGKYQVHGLNNNSQCEDWSKEVYIINSPMINVDINSTPNCTDICSGKLSATVTGGVPLTDGTYNYYWENGETTSTITDLCTGNYKITISDAVGCNTFVTGTVGEGFSILSTLDSISCFMESDGEINTSITGGISPFQYLWSNGETTTGINQLGTGTYQLTVTDALNCTDEIEHELTAPNELTISLFKTDASCFGATDGSIQATVVGGHAPYNLIWNTPVQLDTNNLSAGSYMVTLSDRNNCETIQSITVDEPVILSVDLTITNPLDCHQSIDGAISASAIGGTAPYNYLWSNGENGSSIAGLSADTFSVTVTDAHDCTHVSEIIMAAPEALNLTITDQQNISCFGGSNGAIQTTITGGATPYQSYLNNDMVDNGNIANLVKGQYEVYVMDANNCSTSTSTVSITQPDSLSITVDKTSVICPGTPTGTAIITTTGGTAAYQYLWDSGLTENTSAALAKGNYKVTITDSNTCEKSIIFEITSPDTLMTQFSIEHVKCFGDKDGFVTNISSTGGIAPYSYYLNGGNLPVNNQQLDSLPEGVYQLRTVDSNDCEITNELIISEPELLIASIAVIDSLKCQGGGDGRIEVVATGGTLPYSYLWEDGSTAAVRSDLVAGTYQVTIVDANDCFVNDQIDLLDGAFLEILTSDPENVSCWGADDGAFNIFPQGGTPPFQYYMNQELTATSEVLNLAAGNYTVYFTDVNNCVSTTEVVAITTPDALLLDVETTSVVCPEGNTGTARLLPLGGTLPYQFQWNNNLSTIGDSNLVAGEYMVTVTDQNECKETIDFEIKEPFPMYIDYEATGVSCYGEEDGMAKIEYNGGGTAPYIHYLDDEFFPEDDLTIRNLDAGTYTLVTTDSEGCEIMEMLTILEPPLFTVDIGDDQQVVLGENVAIPISIENGMGDIQYAFSPSDYLDCSSAYINECPMPKAVLPLRNISYEIALTDENGCVAKDDINIYIDNSDKNIYLGNAFSPNSIAGNDVFYVQSNISVERVVKFQIFNRWGGQVFEALDFQTNDKTFGWNGYYQGTQADVGVYIYVVEYQTIDGKLKKKVGDVTLLK